MGLRVWVWVWVWVWVSVSEGLFRSWRSGAQQGAKSQPKSYDTRYSRVVPHHSTDRAVTSLTSEIRRDPVISGAYGRS